MVAFILTMPNVGSWNNKWSGEGKVYCRVKLDRQVPKEARDKGFFYE